MSTTSIACAAPAPALAEALHVYLARGVRTSHPAGTFDRAGRWFPDNEEQRDCCTSIRSHSRTWPYSLIKHCRSVQHVAALHNVDVRALRRALRASDYATSRRAARDVVPEALIAEPGWTGDTPITPEEALRAAGIDDVRQAEYQRKMSVLLAGRNGA